MVKKIFAIASFVVAVSCNTGTADTHNDNVLKERVTVLESRVDSLSEPHNTGTNQNSIIQKQTVTEQTSYSGQCGAKTKKGGRCRRSVRSGGYCWQHGG